MNKKQILIFLMAISPVLLAPPQKLPNPRALEARDRLREKLKQKTNGTTESGKETLERLRTSQQQGYEASKEFINRTLSAAHKKSTIKLGKVSEEMLEASTDELRCQQMNDLLNGNSISNRRQFDALAGLTRPTTTEQ